MGDESDLTDARWLGGGRTPTLLRAEGIVLRDTADVSTDAIIEVLREQIDGYMDQWMPWADGGWDEDASRAYLDGEARQQTEWAYAIHDSDGTIIGVASLIARRGPGSLEIGYWVRRDRQGEGFATRAAALLADAALTLPTVERVEIHHDAANHASAAVPRKLGSEKVREEPREPVAPGESGTTWVWWRTR